MTDLTVANTIKQQILAGCGSPVVVGSWGAKNWVGGENFLQFKVNGRFFKGFVKVTLDYGTDTYNIKFYTIRKKRGSFDYVEKVYREVSDIYCDYLAHVIDETVEIGYEESVLDSI